MRIPNRFFIALLLLVLSITLNAQVDKEKKSIRIPAETSKKKKDSSPIKIKVAPKDKPSLTKIDKNKINGLSVKKKKFITEKKPFSMIDDDGLRNPGELFEERWNKDAVKAGIKRVMSDQFLGEHRIDSKFVNIVCRDHEYPDGDRVQIIVNDKIVHPNILLTGSYRRVQINLSDGINKIDILALNQGDSGPNTAEFVVYDDKQNIVSSKEWNLLTGVKATIVFVNEKVTIESKTAGN